MKPHNKALLSGILSLVAVIGLFSPGDDPFIALWGNISALFAAVGSGRPFLLSGYRPVLAILAVGFLYNGIVAYVFRNAPLSTLKTTVFIRFLRPDGSRVRIRREQVFRANRANVKAYFMTMQPAPGASVPENEIDVRLNHAPGVESDYELIGSAIGGWECYQEFKPAIPYTPFFPFVPKWLFLLGQRHNILFLRKYALMREVSSLYVNDFNQEKPAYKMAAVRYPQHNISVLVQFDKSRCPLRDQIFAHIIQENGVQKVDVAQPTGESECTYEVKVATLSRGTRLRVSWRLPPEPAIAAGAQRPPATSDQS